MWGKGVKMNKTSKHLIHFFVRSINQFILDSPSQVNDSGLIMLKYILKKQKQNKTNKHIKQQPE